MEEDGEPFAWALGGGCGCVRGVDGGGRDGWGCSRGCRGLPSKTSCSRTAQIGFGSFRLRFSGIDLWLDSGGVGSFAAEVAGLWPVMEWGFDGERRGASGVGFTRAAMFMMGVEWSLHCFCFDPFVVQAENRRNAKPSAEVLLCNHVTVSSSIWKVTDRHRTASLTVLSIPIMPKKKALYVSDMTLFKLSLNASFKYYMVTSKHNAQFAPIRRLVVLSSLRA